MADELYDDEFHVPFPSWLLVRNDCVQKIEDGTTRFVKDPVWSLIRDTLGESAVPVFTDEHTAAAYCEASGLLDDVTMIAATDASFLADVLTLIGGREQAKNVAFDPKAATGVTPRIWPIDYAAERIRKGLGLR